MPAKILTAYAPGGEYRPEHVDRLRAQCAEHAPGVPFVCVTSKWPGWWCKIDTLRVEGPVLYMDLDTSIVGGIAPLLNAAAQHRFIALKNPYPEPSLFGSGLMGWNGDMSHVYARFAQDPQTHMARCKTKKRWGDQGFISEDEPDPVFWQDLCPNQIVSWKVDCAEGVPKKARVIYFHGKPRPWDIGM